MVSVLSLLYTPTHKMSKALKTLTLSEKLQVLKEAESGKSQRQKLDCYHGEREKEWGGVGGGTFLRRAVAYPDHF